MSLDVGLTLGLSGRVVLVTGASSGIGARVGELFGAAGAQVIAHGYTGVERLERWCKPAGFPMLSGDLTDPGQVDALMAEASGFYGRVDAVIAVAGRWPEPDLLIDETPVADLRATLDANLWSAMLTARAFFAQLRAQPPVAGGASLVFIGSTAGAFGEAGHVAYATAKAGLHGLVATLKNEIVKLDPHGRVNAVAPGWTVTPAVAAHVTPDLVARVTRTMPLRRIASTDDIANAVLYLASPVTARHVTGQWLTVAGGMEGRMLWE